MRWTFEGRSAGSRTAMPMATDSDEVRALVKRVAPALAGELSGDQLRHLWLELSSTAESDDDFAVTVRTEPDLRMPLHFFLASRVDVSYLPTVYWGWPTDHVLEPGEPEIGLRTGGYEDKYGGLSGALFVNSVLAFHSNDRKPATEPRWEEIRSENQGR
ncbi:hypothetical protein ACIRSS_41330 [Amycolatopsis sp. NPDC101161]|uniref:hypothetical protein n=1 Tax=Amycolatopsis sp. NPDC101161 TaxID=3363940 RepID=UPI00382F6443